MLHPQSETTKITLKRLQTENCPELSVSTEIFKNSNTHAINSRSDD